MQSPFPKIQTRPLPRQTILGVTELISFFPSPSHPDTPTLVGTERSILTFDGEVMLSRAETSNRC